MRLALVTAAPLLLASSIALAAPPSLELETPASRSAVRGEPASLRVAIEPPPPWASELRVEVDGEIAHMLLPWSRETHVELEPGLHRVAVVGRDRRDDARLRSATVQVAVFREAQRPQLRPRAHNGWMAVVSFGIAIGGAAALRRRGSI